MSAERSCCAAPCAGVALLRWALGLLFLAGGVAILFTLKEFVTGYLVPAFTGTFLPVWLLTLAFGQMLIQGSTVVANIMVCILMAAIVLVFQEHDRWTLGGCKSKGTEPRAGLESP